MVPLIQTFDVGWCGKFRDVYNVFMAVTTAKTMPL
jgi:hypothetical protein